MESDRMGHLLGVIDQARLDEQRGVVQNEKRQGEDQPYGKLYRVLVESAYPAGHPYSWAPIGSMQDLDAATLEDVREWFRTWYGAANAVIVVAGDVDAQDVLRRVAANFGDIPPGPPLVRPGPWVAKRTSSQRVVLEDRVPQARLVKAWNVPPWGSSDGDRLALAAAVLGSGKTSRCTAGWCGRSRSRRRRRPRLAARDRRPLRGRRDRAAGAGPRRARARLDQELARLLEDGPSREELARVKAEERASFLRGIEKVGGWRQVRPARRERGLRRQPGRLAALARAASGRQRPRGARRSQALARCGLHRDRGAAGCRASRPGAGRGSQPAAGAGCGAGGELPALARTRPANGLRADRGRAKACRWCASSCWWTRAMPPTATRPRAWPSWRSRCFPRARGR
jgi:hypothetical protein